MHYLDCVLERQDAKKHALNSDNLESDSLGAHHSEDSKSRAELLKLYGKDGRGTLIKIGTVDKQ